MMTRKLSLVLTLLFTTILMEAQVTPQPTYLGDDKDRYLRSRPENKGIENAELKVSPPHWFKGMTNDQVELMVYQIRIKSDGFSNQSHQRIGSVRFNVSHYARPFCQW